MKFHRLGLYAFKPINQGKSKTKEDYFKVRIIWRVLKACGDGAG